MARFLVNRPFTRRGALALGLIGIGLVMVMIFGARSLRSYQQLRYIREQGLDQGIASVRAIQPWMTIRYVAVAYAVPEEYLFAQLEIPFDRRNSNTPLGRLEREYNLGPPEPGENPLLFERLAAAILAYRENPVATGLTDIRPWMSIRYIANSTGARESEILQALGITSADNQAVLPLDQLAAQIEYPGGPHELVEAIMAILREQEGGP